MYTRYFPYDKKYDHVDKISYIKIYCQKFQVNYKSKARIRVLSYNPKTNNPNIDIIRENLILTLKKGMNTIDISKYNIPMPKEGVFVAIEWLIIEENAYESVWYKNKIKHTKISYGPILGANYYEKPQTWLYWAGK